MTIMNASDRQVAATVKFADMQKSGYSSCSATEKAAAENKQLCDNRKIFLITEQRTKNLESSNDPQYLERKTGVTRWARVTPSEFCNNFCTKK